MLDDDVDGLEATGLPKGRVRLSWEAIPDAPCVYTITYTVFRSLDDAFSPAEKNRVIQGVKSTIVILPEANPDSYYHVRAVKHPAYCSTKPEPGFHGSMTFHPLANDAGGLYVSLRTKWQVGSNQLGALSYIFRAIYLGPGDSGDYYDRARRCSYSAMLLDAQGFKVRTFEIGFTGMETQGKVTSLESNDIASVTPKQFRDFDSGGNWSLGWDCPKH